MKKKILLVAALLSLVWNFFLVTAATLNVSSLLPHVAGGQFHSLPVGLRVTYGVQALVIIFQFFFIIRLYQRSGAWSKTSFLLARIFLALSTLSAFVNDVSRSPVERWNAIAAAIIAYGFYVLAELNFRPSR